MRICKRHPHAPGRRPARHGMLLLLVAVVLIALGAAAPAAAGDGGGRSVFATGAGNRALALGGAFAAAADDPSAMIWNPAGLGLLQRKELQATQTRLFGLGFGEQYASLVLPDWRRGTLAATWRRFGVDGIEGRDDRGLVTDRDLRDAETELLLGYGHCLAGGDLSLGAAVKIRHHRLADLADSGLGLDLGLWLRPLGLFGADAPGARSLALGLAVRNALEPRIKLADESVPDPLALRAGLAWTWRPASRLRLLALADVEQTRGMDGRLHAGLEAGLEDLLALRLGSADGVLTAGLGLRWQSIGTDYQFEDNPLGTIHRFGISLAFGPTTAQSELAARAAAEAAAQRRLEEAFQERNRRRERELRGQMSAAMAAGRWEEALTILGTLQVLAPTAADLPTLAAEAYGGHARQQERKDDLAGAALSWRRVLTHAPDHPAAAAALIRVQDESDRRARRSHEIRARWEDALDALAADDLEAARDGFQAILALAPADHDAASMLEHTEKALASRAAARALASLPAAEPAATATPASAPAAAAEQEPQPEQARPAVALSPARQREIADLYGRGLDAMQAGRRAEAVHYWELVWNADPDHEHVREYLTREYLAQGMEEFAGGALQRAVASWEQAVRIDPDDPRARGYLDRALQQLTRMQQISRDR